MTTLAKFYDQLEAHDWYFDYSDDHRVWRDGLASYDKLRETARESDAHDILFQQYSKYKFSGRPFDTNPTPKPKRPE